MTAKGISTCNSVVMLLHPLRRALITTFVSINVVGSKFSSHTFISKDVCS